MRQKFNFLEARAKTSPEVSTKAPKIRRKGIGALIAQLQLKHPNLPDRQLEAMAKSQWSQQPQARGAK